MAEIIALVGSETLLGREVREVFGETSLGDQLRLLAGDEEDSTRITAIGGDARYLSQSRSRRD